MGPDTRALTRDEVALARRVFGDAIAYDAVELRNRRWAFFQPRQTVMAPTGHIHFNPRGDLYCDDFCAVPSSRQGLLIHELTHVWQVQTRGRLYLVTHRHPFCRYAYTLKPGWPLARYGIEQQAEIVRHYFLLLNGQSVAGAPGIDAYRAILPFSAA